MSKFIGCYYINWRGYKYAINKLPEEYNQIYLFHAVPIGNGFVKYESPGGEFYNDCIISLKQGRRLLISVGGANNGFELKSRKESDNFITSIKGIIQRISGGSGGHLGLDWNNFEADVPPSTGEMIYVSRLLKEFYGPDFVITSPVAPWRDSDKTWATEMDKAGVLDYVSPQYYDGPSLNTTAYLMQNLATWIDLLGQDKVGVGYGILSSNNTGHYWTPAEIAICLKQVLTKWPKIRGFFVWEIISEIENGHPFYEILMRLIPKPATVTDISITGADLYSLKMSANINGKKMTCDIKVENLEF